MCDLLHSCPHTEYEYDYEGEREGLFPLESDDSVTTEKIPETASWARVSVPGGLPLGATTKKNEIFVSPVTATHDRRSNLIFIGLDVASGAHPVVVPIYIWVWPLCIISYQSAH